MAHDKTQRARRAAAAARLYPSHASGAGDTASGPSANISSPTYRPRECPEIGGIGAGAE